MSNAAITTIITGLATVATDGTATNAFQDDVIFELARGAYPDVLAQVGAAFVAVTAETATYTIPTASNARTPLMIFHDTRQLFHVRKDEAWAYEAEWRDAPDPHVVGYVMEPEDRPNFALVPPPKVAGATIGGAVPTGATFPAGNILVVYAQSDTAFAGTTYDDLKLPVALEALSRELARDSDHQDKMAADVAHNLADFFFRMTVPVGVLT